MITDQLAINPSRLSVQPARQAQAELVNTLFRQSRAAGFGTFIAVALATYVLWGHVPRGALISWTVIACMITSIRVGVASYYMRLQPGASNPLKWSWIGAAISGLVGCVWGALGFFFFAPDDLLVTIFISLLLAGITSSGVASLSAFWPAYCALVLPSLLPLAVHSLLHGGELIFVVGILLLFLMLVNLSYCHTVHKILQESLAMRFENLELLHQLTVEKERAETANRAKSQFLAAASHDLRQPTHAIALFVATLRALAARPELKRAEVEHIAGRLQETLKSLGQLLNALLDVSRLDAGVVKAEKRPIALQDALTTMSNEFSGPARAKGLELVVMPTSLWVQSDPVVLHRVLANLVSNAVRYTSHGRVLIGCRRQATMVEVQVCDTGIGIAPEQFEKIFQEFYQVHNVARDREQGLGLGLAIVRRLVDLLGARLHIQSTVGKGSLFALRLPRADPLRSFPAPFEEVRSRQGKTVLVIDDDREILEAVYQLLSVWGHTAILAATLEQALSAASEHAATISLILADYRLAENTNGADAILAVFGRLNRVVPAVIITGDTSPDRIREANASGFKLLHKPLDPEQLQQLMHEN